MDWEENYRPDRDRQSGYAGDARPRTPEELRARNARREKPELDAQAARRQRTRRPAKGQGKAGQSGRDSTRREDGSRQRAASSEFRNKKAQQRKRVRKPRREAPNPEAEVHWSEPKPFIRKVFFLKLAATLAVVLAVALGFSIFFKVGRITVAGTEKYTPEAVLEASGIEKGEGLLTLGKAKKAGNILSALPYVKEVQIGIKLPDTVNINIVELAVTYAIRDTEGRWWLMDSGGKLVEGVSETEAAGHTMVTGLIIQNPQVGSMIEAMAEKLPGETAPETTPGSGETMPDGETEATEPETQPAETEPLVTSPDTMTGSGVSKVEAVTEILHALEQNNLMGEIRQVDVTYLFNITLWYGDRFEIRLGQPVELGYKVNYMAQAISSLADYQIGVLDVTFENEREVRFIPAETAEDKES